MLASYNNIVHNGVPALQDRWYQQEAVDALFNYCMAPRELMPDGKIKPRNPLICLPTGTGKSIVIARFLQRIFGYIPSTRVVMATHVKELIKQNANKLNEVWAMAPLGIYSAGLKSRDVAQPIIFGGIQSLVGKYPIFGVRNLLIIDEAHLLADEGSYIRFIEELLAKNPYLIVIGLTATPYRMGLGLMTNGKIFTDIIYDMTNIEGFNRLMADGYLCPLVPKRTNYTMDVSGVGIANGDYIQNQLQAAVDTKDINYAILSESLPDGADRRSGLIFASGIEHAEHIGEMMKEYFQEDCLVLHSKMGDAHNDAALKAWKAGEVKYAVNMNMLTTGVDNPMLDFIIDMQPTTSTGKHVQKYGRGTRPYQGKLNCLVKDHAGNTRRLGPIDDPVVPRLKGKGPPGDAPVRICPNCNVYNHARATSCVACGTEFTFDPKINKHASDAPLMASDLPQIETFRVDRVVYSLHTKRFDGSTSIKASYYCGLRTFYEYKNFEAAKPLGRHYAHEWFRQRHSAEPPKTNLEALQYSSILRAPQSIRVWINKKPNPEILTAEF